MSKKIVLINAHPNHASFNFGLPSAYKRGALLAGAEVKEIVIAALRFNPNLQYGYQKKMEWEQDLVDAWEKIVWADHLVWVHPVWWGGMPSLAKGFIDRVFLPGFAFKYRKNSVYWDKLLKGKTAHIITTLDQPGWYYWLIYGRPSVNQLKKSTLQFCGVSPVKVSYFGIIKRQTTRSEDSGYSRWKSSEEILSKRISFCNVFSARMSLMSEAERHFVLGDTSKKY